jgi:hypothetical protein
MFGFRSQQHIRLDRESTLFGSHWPASKQQANIYRLQLGVGIMRQ